MGDDGAALAALAPCSCSNSPCRGNDRPRPCDTARPSHLARGPSRRCPARGSGSARRAGLRGSLRFLGRCPSRLHGARGCRRAQFGFGGLARRAHRGCPSGGLRLARRGSALLRGGSHAAGAAQLARGCGAAPRTIADGSRSASSALGDCGGILLGRWAGGLSHRERKRFPLRGEIA